MYGVRWRDLLRAFENVRGHDAALDRTRVSSCACQQLVLARRIELADGEPVGSGRDDVCADFRSRSAPRLDPVTCRAALRGPRTPASTAGTATVPTSTTAPGESGPVPLGVAVMRVGRLANGRRDREAGNRRRLASPGLSLILDMEKSPPPRTTARRRRCPRPDSDDVRARPAVGSTTHFTVSS